MPVVLSKGKETDFIALLVFGVLFLFYKQHGRCILCLVILGGCFFLFQGDGPAKPFRENMGPEDILDGKSLTCSTWKRRSQTLSHPEWILRLTRKHTWIFVHLFRCRKKVPTTAPWPNQPRVWKPSSWALGMSTKPDCDQPEGSSSQRGDP